MPNKVRGQVPFTAQYSLVGEMTFIPQHIFPFSSPYSGQNSLLSRSETEVTHTYTLYFGTRPTPRLEIYLNSEIALGHGVSSGEGLAGYSNGDLIGQPSLASDPYIARFFVRWRIPLQSRGTTNSTQDVPHGTNEIGGNLPISRLVITAGKFAISDHFDANSYANNARVQFMNNAFINNLAYDKAGDTRGYNLGLMMAWINPRFALRLASMAMPTTGGGPNVTYSVTNAHSDQMELELHPQLFIGRTKPPMILRLLTYRNVGTMGRYKDIQRADSDVAMPDISVVRRKRASKYGFGINMEQAIGDGGRTGIFGRFGWSDGNIEDFCYAEADRTISVGGQLSGIHWGRQNDVIGVAAAQSNLSAIHKAFLEAGGMGLSLGDGQLNYEPERIVEVYYAYQLTGATSLSLDYQFISSPGYNQDRGPASLLGLRLHLTF